MAMVLGAMMLLTLVMFVALLRSPLGRAVMLSVDCFAEASRGEPGALH
jgi:hypothetical protein